MIKLHLFGIFLPEGGKIQLLKLVEDKYYVVDILLHVTVAYSKSVRYLQLDAELLYNKSCKY